MPVRAPRRCATRLSSLLTRNGTSAGADYDPFRDELHTMNEREWLDVLERANRDVAGIIHNQRILDEINETLRQRRSFEEDFILHDAFGRGPGEPRLTN